MQTKCHAIHVSDFHDAGLQPLKTFYRAVYIQILIFSA